MHYKKLITGSMVTFVLPLLLTSCFLQPTEDSSDGSLTDNGLESVTDSALDVAVETVDIEAILDEIENYTDDYPLVEITPKLQVEDESLTNPEVQLLVLKLKDAVSSKDTEALLSLIAEDVHYSHIEGSGKDEFIDYWNLRLNPEDSEIWPILEALFPYGGAFTSETSYVIPYMASTLSGDYNAVVTDTVNLREDTTTDSIVLERLNFDYVNLIEVTEDIYVDDGIEYSWVKIRASSGTVGYVVSKYIYIENNYRVGISNEDGEWQITSIITGE